MRMRRQNPNGHWIHYGDVGIRCFPRAGSASIQETYNRSADLGYFLAAEHHVVVVRNPLQRLASIYYGMVRPGEKFNGYALPSGVSLDEFIEWLIEQDPFTCDVHVAPMWAQMQGYYNPPDDVLITMESFFKQPPFNLPPVKVHRNQTPRLPQDNPANIPPPLLKAWYDWGGKLDIKLYQRAKKSPLSLGGEAGTTGDWP